MVDRVREIMRDVYLLKNSGSNRAGYPTTDTFLPRDLAERAVSQTHRHSG